MYKRYKAKHFKENVKLNGLDKLLIVAILLCIFAFESMSGIFSYFTAEDSSNNEFTIAEKYTVHFDSNEGTGTMPDQIMYRTYSDHLDSNDFTRAGYGFNGWNTAANGTGTSYEDGELVTDITAGSSITLYAQWIAGAYSILYNLDDGSVETSNPTAYLTDTPTFTLNNPTKPGYVFTGWSGTDLIGDTNLTVTIPQGSTGDREYTAHYIPNTYNISFDANGGDGTESGGLGATMPNQVMTIGNLEDLNANTYYYDGYYFVEWNTDPNGNGTSYTDGESVTDLTLTANDTVTLYAIWAVETNVAEVVGVGKYATIAEAMTVAQNLTGHQTVRLLKSVAAPGAAAQQAVKINSGKDITLDLRNYTLSNGSTDINIITNNGTLEIIGGPEGTITSNNAKYGAIDNNASGNLTIDGIKIIKINGRQAVYNNGGTVEIKGDAYISSDLNTGTTSNDRATVQNAKPQNGTAGTITISGGTIVSLTASTSKAAVENANTGTVIITGGTIISKNNVGVDNSGTLTIGVEDGIAEDESPIIQGAAYGVKSTSSGTLEFYDGIVKGKTHAFNDENYITDKEDNYDIEHGTEVIDGYNYEIAYLDSGTNRLMFYGNGGTPIETVVHVPDDTAIGALLPSAPTREHYSFDGWFTDPENGTQITSSTVITQHESYYAHWTLVEAEVTYNANGGTMDGTNEEDTIVVNVGSSIGSANLPMPIKPYNTFDGWYTDPNPNSGTLIDGTETITQDVTYYAHWTQQQATVTYNANGGTMDGTNVESTVTVDCGTSIGSANLPTPTRPYNTFVGWYTDPDPSLGTLIDGTETIIQNVTYYAHWTQQVANVTYNANGGTLDGVNSEDTIVVNIGTSIGSSNLPTPTKPYSTFAGWYTDPSPNGGTLIDGTENITQDVTYYAHWTQQTATVTYNANGGTMDGTNVTSTATVNCGTSIGSSNLPTPIRQYKNFEGWYTDPDPSLGTLIDGTETITQNVTYYAHWSQQTATVTYNANGGTMDGTNVTSTATIDCGTSIGSGNLPTPTRQYKTFAGWYTDQAQNSGTLIDGTETITQNVTYYAHWTAVSVTVTFDPTSGTIPQADASRTVEAGDQVGTLPTTATRSGYYFGGWWTDPNPANGVRAKATDIIGDTTVTYYAYWISNPVAQIGAIYYETLQKAIRDVPTDNTQTTILLLQDRKEAVEIITDQNIILDLQNYTLRNDGTGGNATLVDPIMQKDKRAVVMENYGTLEITNGTIRNSTGQAAINNYADLTLDGVTLTITGTRQGIYNTAGNVLITGNSYISASSATQRAVVQGVSGGTITIDGATLVSDIAASGNKGVIENPASGTVIIKDATITSNKCIGVDNKGTLILGEEDGTAGNTTPVIQGATYGVKTSGNGSAFKFYDGIVKGITNSISGSVADYEDGASRVNATETIGTDTYNTTCYQ